MQAYHCLYTGDSGGGKSTLLAEAADRFPGLVVIVDATDRGESKFSGRGVLDCATVRNAREARAANASIIRIRTDDMTQGARDARELALEYSDSTGWPSQVIIDECQQVMSDELESSHPIKKMLHEDRDRRLKCVLATQDPSDLQPNYSAIKQCRYFVWVGEWSTFHDGFIRYFSIPRGSLPEQPYKWVCFDKRMNVVNRGETRERYA